MPWTVPTDVAHRSPAIDAVVRQIQEALRSLPEDQYESAVRGILESVKRLEAEVEVEQAADVLAAVPLYGARADPRETAIAFFLRHYDGLVQRRLIYADDLRRHDHRLYRALSVHLAGRGRRLGDLVPIRPVTVRRRSAAVSI